MAMRSTSLARHICRPATAQSITKSTRTGLNSRSLRDTCTVRQPAQTRASIQTQSALTGSLVLTRRYASTKSSTQQYGAGETGVTGAPDITNYYTIFPRTLSAGPPPASSFDIPVGDLRREFLQLQNAVHPDKYPSGEVKQHAEAISARINEAYRTLVDPLQRAQYLLREWHGIDVLAEDGASKHALDPETLMEVMEVQETIEEVGASPEAEAEIDALKKENDQRIEACVKSLGDAIDRNEIETARKECVRLRFWYSVGEGLREWEPGTTEIRLVHGN